VNSANAAEGSRARDWTGQGVPPEGDHVPATGGQGNRKLNIKLLLILLILFQFLRYPF
jgi:hypothetical protein